MPPSALCDLSTIDFSKPVLDREGIRKFIPHRGAIEQLDAVVHLDLESGLIVGYRDVRDDEFWVEGHIPGRPLLPGVLQLEMAAQLASVFMANYPDWNCFLGFGGMDNVRFRAPVIPGQRLIVVMQRRSIRHGRFVGQSQGYVNGNIAFEADIIGIKM